MASTTWFSGGPLATTFAIVQLSLSWLGATDALGQTPTTQRPGDRTLGAWVGISLHSPVGSHFGITPGREMLLLGLRAAYVLESRGPAALSFTGDLLPAVIVTDNPTYVVLEETTPYRVIHYKAVTGRAPVYGAGFSSGLELSSAMGKRVRAFGSGAAGMTFFTRDMPVPDASRFNISFEFGGGVQVGVGERGGLLLGYKFHHLSNAYSARFNPGLDGEVFYAGIVRRR